MSAPLPAIAASPGLSGCCPPPVPASCSYCQAFSGFCILASSDFAVTNLQSLSLCSASVQSCSNLPLSQMLPARQTLVQVPSCRWSTDRPGVVRRCHLQTVSLRLHCCARNFRDFAAPILLAMTSSDYIVLVAWRRAARVCQGAFDVLSHGTPASAPKREFPKIRGPNIDPKS